MATRGRKKTIIDWDVVDRQLIAGYTGTEVAAHLGICPDTLYIQCQEEKKMVFSFYLQQKRAKGNGLIKLAQYDEAINNRDRGMLIWLGKNRLGQSDKETVEHKGSVPIEVVSYNGKQLEPWKDEGKEIDEGRKKS